MGLWPAEKKVERNPTIDAGIKEEIDHKTAWAENELCRRSMKHRFRPFVIQFRNRTVLAIWEPTTWWRYYSPSDPRPAMYARGFDGNPVVYADEILGFVELFEAT